MSAISKVTIEDALIKFLQFKHKSLTPYTFSLYEEVVGLLTQYLNGYGADKLTKSQNQFFQAAYKAGDEGAFCHLFSPIAIIDNLGGFLNYFMIRKVNADQELLETTGIVIQDLTKWLYEKELIDNQALDIALEMSQNSTVNLPKSEKVADMLYDLAQQNYAMTQEGTSIAYEDLIDGIFIITKIEPGTLWFDKTIGPIEVTPQISDMVQLGWQITGSFFRKAGIWYLVEAGNVYPD